MYDKTDKSIGIELRSLNNQIMRFLNRHTASNAEVDKITMSNAWIIGYIANHPDEDVFQRDIEHECYTTRSTVSRVIDLMIKKGFIERRSVPNDARLKKLVLTPKAARLSDVMENSAIMLNNTMIDGFTPEELENLHSYITRMKNNLKQTLIK